jgi:hypothetical protein
MQHSEWATPTQEEVRELEYTQLEQNNGNGKGNNGTSVPVNSGILFAALVAFIFGLWKSSRTSPRYTSES